MLLAGPVRIDRAEWCWGLHIGGGGGTECVIWG